MKRTGLETVIMPAIAFTAIMLSGRFTWICFSIWKVLLLMKI